MTVSVTPYSLKDAPAFIERLLPVQKLSAEAYKEQMAVQGKTLTALGSYWKGRKPLILNKACILGCLLPATDDLNTRPRNIREAHGHGRRVFRRPLDAPPASRRRSLPRSQYRPHHRLLHRVRRIGSCRVGTRSTGRTPNIQQVKVAWREDLSELERRRLGSTDAAQGVLP